MVSCVFKIAKRIYDEFVGIRKMPRVFVALSGGVDSSVAAFLLKKKGYAVVGVFMKCYNLDGCAEKDAEDARRVASRLKIPFYVFDLEKEYKERVVNYMLRGYREGTTPNPDVMCNKEIKFGIFLEKAVSMGGDLIATGHYVRLRRNFQFSIFNFQTDSKFKIQNSKFGLWQAKDLNKDQSYFLWTLTQEQLKHCLFPIGNYLKSDVREIARRAGLSTAEKKDSQGICFLGKFSLYDFLKKSIPEKKGDILDSEGEKIGEHNGAWFYTIGQRHIGFGDHKGTGAKNAKARYVAVKDVRENTLIMVQGEENPLLYGRAVTLRDLNFIRPIGKKETSNVFVRVRYRGLLSPASLFFFSEDSPVSVRILFKTPQKFITPGQSAVIYSKKGELLGGGVIQE